MMMAVADDLPNRQLNNHMNVQLCQELINIESARNLFSVQQKAAAKRQATLQRQQIAFPTIRKISLIAMITFFLAYRFLFTPKSLDCIFDLLHVMTAPINDLLNSSPSFYFMWIVVAQETIEISILLLCVVAIMRVKNLTIHMFIVCFYGFRAALINIEKFPYPSGIIWEATAIPSYTVPYGITRDFYYSGHTGIMLFCVLWWGKIGWKKLQMVSFIFGLHVVFVLLTTRVHYCIDIVGGIIFTLWIYKYVLNRVIVFDRFFTHIYNGLEVAWIYVRSKLYQ